MVKPKKTGPITLNWVEELLPDSILRKSMFGGFAYYYQEKMILVIFEKPGDRSYRHLNFDFELWNGCMFPVEKDFHAEVLNQFEYLIVHPILPKWLYVPLDSENFDDKIESIMRAIRRPSSPFGVVPKKKKINSERLKARVSQKTIDLSADLDTKNPKMFSEQKQKQKQKQKNK